jgi:hypothetical protein
MTYKYKRHLELQIDRTRKEEGRERRKRRKKRGGGGEREKRREKGLKTRYTFQSQVLSNLLPPGRPYPLMALSAMNSPWISH